MIGGITTFILYFHFLDDDEKPACKPCTSKNPNRVYTRKIVDYTSKDEHKLEDLPKLMFQLYNPSSNPVYNEEYFYIKPT